MNRRPALPSVGTCTVTTPTSMLGFGQVRHSRLRPVANAFTYPTYFLMLPLRSLKRDEAASLSAKGTPTCTQGWRINKRGALSFFEADHGDGRSPEKGGALAWLDELLQREGIFDATGEAWLHCYPRVLGYTFKPVSFWYCHRAQDNQGGSLRAIVVEVNNTFGERHCYLLDAPAYGKELRASKVFHVSPFCKVEGHYRFRFMRSTQRGINKTVARIDYCDCDDATGGEHHGQPQGPAAVLLQTSVSGTLEPITPRALRRGLWRYPAMTLGVVLHIHWQALRLWIKSVPFIGKPKPPETFVTR